MEPVRTLGGIWGDCKGGLTTDNDSVRRHLLEDLQQLMPHRGRAGRCLRDPPLDAFTEMSPPQEGSLTPTYRNHELEGLRDLRTPHGVLFPPHLMTNGVLNHAGVDIANELLH